MATIPDINLEDQAPRPDDLERHESIPVNSGILVPKTLAEARAIGIKGIPVDGGSGHIKNVLDIRITPARIGPMVPGLAQPVTIDELKGVWRIGVGEADRGEGEYYVYFTRADTSVERASEFCLAEAKKIFPRDCGPLKVFNVLEIKIKDDE